MLNTAVTKAPATEGGGGHLVAKYALLHRPHPPAPQNPGMKEGSSWGRGGGTTRGHQHRGYDQEGGPLMRRTLNESGCLCGWGSVPRAAGGTCTTEFNGHPPDPPMSRHSTSTSPPQPTHTHSFPTTTVTGLVWPLEGQLLGKGLMGYARVSTVPPPSPLCRSHALVQATAGAGIIFIWDLL